MPIKVDRLNHTYNEGLPSQRQSLYDISFTVEQGSILAVLGHTGSGKSTLAQHLNALIIPQSGSVEADGLNASKAGDRRGIRQKTGLVFQYPEEQIFAETIYDEIAFAPQNWGAGKSETDAAVDWARRETGLPESMMKMSPYNISGGQKRRVAIASVIAARPSYLVLDEPTAGLDSASAAALLSMLTRFAGGGMGIVLITHDIEAALTYADSIMVLQSGAVVSLAAPRETAALLCSQTVMGLAVPEILSLSNSLRNAGRISALAWTPEQLAEGLKKNNHDIG